MTDAAETLRREIDRHHMDYRGYCFGCGVYRLEHVCPIAERLSA